MARKKTAQKSNKSSGFTSLQSILSNERTDFIFGLCFVAVSIFFVISFVHSYVPDRPTKASWKTCGQANGVMKTMCSQTVVTALGL